MRSLNAWEMAAPIRLYSAEENWEFLDNEEFLNALNVMGVTLKLI